MPTTAACGAGTGPLPWPPSAMQPAHADVFSTTAPTPAMPVAVAARLQALLRRGMFERGDGADMEHTPATQPCALQQVPENMQPQQEQLAVGSRQVTPPPPAGVASQGPAAPGDVLARLQQLRARQAAAEPPDQQAALAAGGPSASWADHQGPSSTQQLGVVADLAGPSNHVQDEHDLQQPHDYVAALQQLLARQQQQDGEGALHQQQDPGAAAAAAAGEGQHGYAGAGVEDMEEDYWGDGSAAADLGPAGSHPHLGQAAMAAGDQDIASSQGGPGTPTAAPAAAANAARGSPSMQQPPQPDESPMSEEGAAHDAATSALTQRLLALASRCLTAGDMVEAAQHAQHAQQMAARPAQQREASQLLALCHVLQHAGALQWQQLLSLEPGEQGSAAPGCDVGISATTTGSSSSSLGHYKRQYKRLAALVHPDKCSHPAANSAFKALQQALHHMQQQLRGSDLDQHQPGSDGDVSGDDAAWWAEWDAEVAAEGQQRQQQQPTSEPREEDCEQDQELWSVPLLVSCWVELGKLCAVGGCSMHVSSADTLPTPASLPFSFLHVLLLHSRPRRLLPASCFTCGMPCC